MLNELRRTSAPLTVTALLMVPFLAIALTGLAVDPRLVTGVPVWLKPAKFAASIAIYVLTLAWIFRFIPSWERTRSTVGWLTAVAMVVEITLISLQALRGTESHFNVGTILDGAIFTIMGIAIVGQTLSVIAVAVALWQQQHAERALGWALRLGVSITIVGALSGGLMTRPTQAQIEAARAGEGMTTAGAHTVGGPDGEPGLPVTGWSTRHGDLRIPHFVGLHALQALPLVALLLRRRDLHDRVRVRLTVTAATSYAGAFALLMTQALRGEALLAPSATTVAWFAAWAIVTIAAGLLAVRPFRDRTAEQPKAEPLPGHFFLSPQ